LLLARPSLWGEPTEVKVGIYVIDIDSLDSANQNFSASVYYEARWKSPLLEHEGPGPKFLPTSAVWTPRLGIVNQQQAWYAAPQFVEITPEGEVVLRQKVWGWFSQPLDLRNFPQDEQTLAIHMVAGGLLQTEVAITPLLRAKGRSSGIAQSFSIPDFSVVSWTAEPRPYVPFPGQPGTAGFIMELKMKRHAGYYVWKLIVPLCLIVAMSWVPRWIDPREIGPNIGISATAFLTLIAYYFATTVLLPRVSYITRMDFFILMANVMVFLALLQTVVTSSYVSRADIRVLRRIDLWSRLLYPFALAVVLAASFSNLLF
jgi:hypothetical protein